MIDQALFNEQRHQAAERAFAQYDFGDTTIEETGSWEWTQPGDEISRPLFLAPIEPEAEGTDKAHFTVRFKGNDSIEVLEAYALTESGSLF